MIIRMEAIDKITSAMRPNSTQINVDCYMKERQMHDALLVFLEHISGETWQKWVDEINETD